MNKLCLAILDGFGIVEKGKKVKTFKNGSLLTNKAYKNNEIFTNIDDDTDAVVKASNRDFVDLFKQNPYSLLCASGEAVGLPEGQMGNSEVGHQNIGAGRVVLQDLMRINKSFKDKSILENANFMAFVNSSNAKHIIGLTSTGNVHSSIEHLFYIMDILKQFGKKAYIHIITDGRDTGVNQGIEFVKQVQEKAEKDGHIVASISGRYYAMDREGNLDRTQKYFDMLKGSNVAPCGIIEYIKDSYYQNITDEFIKPRLFDKKYIVGNNDDILFFNFRADRVRQITQFFLEKTKCNVYTMTQYKKEFVSAKTIFEPDYINGTLSEILANHNAKQLKVAELSKYAHVTYFLNGRKEQPFENEDRVMVPMADVDTFDKKPEMSAEGVTNVVLDGMQKAYDFICVNYANCDMVGHTGSLKATLKAVKCVTNQIMTLYQNAKKYGYILVVTADHGNAEQMLENNKVCTTHTTNRVPFIVLNAGNVKLLPNGALCNIAPTILELMKL